MNTLTFDETLHTYCLDGMPVPSITWILKEAGLMDTSHFNEYVASRGTAVHKAIQYYLERDLDESSVAPEVLPYLKGFQAFKKDTGFRVYRSEAKVCSRKHLFAGTFDLYGLMNGTRIICDFKTGTPQPWVGMQLAAYYMAAWECGMRPQRRFCLELKRTGTYRLRECQDRNDKNRFLECLRKVSAHASV